MPLNREAPIAGGSLAISTHDQPDPSTMQVLGAMQQEENPAFSYYSDAKRLLGAADFYRVDGDYRILDNLPKEYLPDFRNGVFDEVYNHQAQDAVISNLDRKKKNEQVIAGSSWPQYLAAMGTTMLTDPTNLIPGGAFVRSGKVGYSVAKSAVSVGLSAGVAAAASEAVLQQSQENRPLSQSTMTVGGSVVLGSLLGMGGAKFFSKGEWGRVSSALAEDLRAEVPNPEEVTEIIVKRMQSAGAAAVENIKLDDLGVGGSKAAQIVANATAATRINPGIQTMLSPSTEVRKTYGQLVDNTIYTTMNMEGKSLGADVENLVKQTQRGTMGR